MKPPLLLAAFLTLLGSGCASLESISSGHIGCPESEIQIFNDQMGWASRSWSARCRGRVFHCIGLSGGKHGAPHISCKAEPGATVAAPQPAYRTASPAGCQYDTQCKGARLCRDGRCVDPLQHHAAVHAPTPTEAATPRPVPPRAAAPTASPPEALSPPSFERLMGMTLGDASQHADRLGLKARQGAVLLTVQPGSAAHRRNLREGDVIVGLTLSRVKSLSDVYRLARKLRAGDSFHIIVQRGARIFSFQMRL